MKMPIVGMIAAAAAIAMVGGCAHQQPEQQAAQPLDRWLGEPPGDTTAGYESLPEYLVEASPEVPPGNVGRWDARVPVAGRAWQPGPTRLDALRVRLAQLDELVVTLRERAAGAAPPAEEQREPVAGQPPPVSLEHAPERITTLATEIHKLVADRPDLEAEADELAQLAKVLAEGVPGQQSQALARITELTDLLRVQLIATSS